MSTTLIKQERKTYFAADIRAKFQGKMEDSSRVNSQERFFNTEILEVELSNLHRISEQEFNNPSFDSYISPALPPEWIVYSHASSYKIKGYEPKVKVDSLLDIVNEGSERFGTLQGKLYAYLIDEVEREVPQGFENSLSPTGEVQTKTEDGRNYERAAYQDSFGEKFWSDWEDKGPAVKVETETTKKEPATNPLVGVFENIGCGSIFLLIFLLLLFANGFTALGIVLLSIVVLWSLADRFPIIGKAFGALFGILAWIWSLAEVYIFLFILVSVVETCNPQTTADNSDNSETDSRKIPLPDERDYVVPPRPKKTDGIKPRNMPKPSNVNDSLILRTMAWKDYHGNWYWGRYTISRVNYSLSYFNRQFVEPSPTLSELSYYQVLYGNLIDFDNQFLGSLLNMYDSIGRANNLDAVAFAEMVVSSVQDIPYVLVVNDACDTYLSEAGFVGDYIRSGKPSECNQKFGLFSPYEFATNQRGDCDTRTVFLYSILSRFGYDVVILNSNKYGHSMLGVALPIGKGTSFRFRGNKYYFWETTAKNFTPGYLSPDLKDVSKWYIAYYSN